MTRILLCFFCIFTIQCSSVNDAVPPNVDGSNDILAGELAFSALNEPIQMNAVELKTITKETSLVFPFEMSEFSEFRLLTSNFEYDCGANKCSGYLRYKILEKSSNAVIATDLRASRLYHLQKNKAYLLVVDLSSIATSDRNYRLNFAVWRGQGQQVHAVTTCEEDATTSFVFSSKGVQIKTPKNNNEDYFVKGYACGHSLSCEFNFLSNYEVDKDLSANGVRFSMTNAADVDDLRNAVTYQAQVNNIGMKDGSLKLLCLRYKAGRFDTAEVFETRKLQNCKTVVSEIKEVLSSPGQCSKSE